MARVVLEPVGNPEAQKHYEDTVRNAVPVAQCAGLPTADRMILQAAFPGGSAQLWGATPARNNTHVKRHAKLRPGDLVLFVERRRVFSRARIRHTFRSPELARQLWGPDEHGQTWELMYAIDEVTPVDIAVSDINQVVGYKPNNVVQGFTVLDDAKSASLLDYLGEFESTEPTSTASDDIALADFKPKDSSEYLATIQAHTQLRRRDHERLIADFGAAITHRGFTPATNVHPRDLTLDHDADHWLVEAKMVYHGDATSAVRAVVGQLFQYRHFLYPQGNPPKLVALFSEPISIFLWPVLRAARRSRRRAPPQHADI
jgi:hypothetical protein